MATDLNFSILKEAGVTQGDFALLCGVTRTTASLWANSHVRPHRFLRPRVERTLNLIDKAVARGDLPLKPPAARGRARQERVFATLRAVVG
jgi:transcriptional regulator with XRE-family HTH domain